MGLKWLWTSGPEQRNNAIKFFAMAFTFVTLVLFTGTGFGVAGWSIPSITAELLAVFWGGYIANARSKDWLRNKNGESQHECCREEDRELEAAT